jgi:hypothetical protein
MMYLAGIRDILLGRRCLTHVCVIEMGKDDAVNMCKVLRPVVDPIGGLSECLTLLDICLTLHRMNSSGGDESSFSGSKGSANSSINSKTNKPDEEKPVTDSPRAIAGRNWWLSTHRIVPVDGPAACITGEIPKAAADGKTVIVGKILEGDGPERVSKTAKKKYSILHYFDRIRAFSAPVTGSQPKMLKVRTNSFPPSSVLKTD